MGKLTRVSCGDDRMQYINCTPHPIVLKDGTTYQPSGDIVRVSASFEEVEPGVYRQVFGEIQGLPEAQDGVRYIVSGLVLSASDRQDLVAPATGHPEVVRNEKGHIVSVPGFVL